MASDLGLHCLLVSFLWDAGHNRVKSPVVFLLTFPRRFLCGRSLFLYGAFILALFVHLRVLVPRSVCRGGSEMHLFAA